MSRSIRSLLLLVFFILCLLVQPLKHGYAANNSAPVTANALTSANNLATGGSGGDTVTPDLFSGTMSYSVPIEVPPGRNGMAPNLSLLYRSSNGNSYLGVGWELEPGAIVRSLKGGVNFSGDAYVLRFAGATIDLVNIGTNANGNTEYRAKIEGSFNRIEQIVAAGQIYWRVTDKTGIKYIYGTTGASRQDDASNAANIFKWCLERVEDPDGNYMTFTYSKDQGQIYLDRVDYAGNGTLAPTNYVKFYWESRNDSQVMYNTDFLVKTARRLKTIDVAANGQYPGGTRIRTYTLEYDIDPNTPGPQYSATTGRSLLTGIQVYGKDATLTASGVVTGGTALPKTSFSYSNPRLAFDPPVQWAPNQSQYYSGYNLYSNQPFQFVGDFNGDGKTDYMYWNGGQGAGWWVLTANSTGTGFNNPVQWAPNQSQYFSGYNSSNICQPFQFVADFNGDGKLDYMYWDGVAGGWWVLTANSTGTGFNNKVQWAPDQGQYYSGYGIYSSQPFQFVGDFNGDGKTDYMYWNGAQGAGWWVLTANSTGTGFNNPVQWAPNQYQYYSGYNLYSSQPFQFLGDFNGDGKTDYMYWNGGQGAGWWALTANSLGTGFNGPIQWAPDQSQYFSGYNSFSNQAFQFTGDFNGDGLTDYMYWDGNVGGWWVMLSNGHGFEPKAQWAPNQGQYFSGYYSTGIHQPFQFVGDFNGDGKTDYMYWDGIVGGWWVLTANAAGTGFNDKVQWAPNQGQYYSGYNIYSSQPFHFVGDFNGDGKMDFMYWNGAQGPGWWILQSQNSPTDLLLNISNGIGANTSITYASSTTFQNTQLPFPVWTVSSVTTCDNYDSVAKTCNGNASTTTYTYSGGYFHMADKEFRGFNYAKVTGSAGPNGEQTVTETWFHQGNDIAVDANTPSDSVGYMKGKPYRVRVSDGLSNRLSETTTAYASGTATPYYYNPPLQVNSSIYSGGVVNKTTRAVYTYDSYGNLTREDNYGDLADPSDDRTTVKTYGYNPINWMMAFPTNISVYQGIGTATQVSGADYYYDGAADCNTASTNQVPTKGKLTRVVRWNGAGTGPEARMAYDGYGNKICGRDGNGNISNLTYDSSFTFPTVATNPLGQQVTTQYYGVNGVAADTGLYGQTKSVTGPNGDVSALQYDVFGRKVRETLPDNSWTATAYNSLGGGVGIQNTATTDSAGLSGWSYFDGLGRTILEKSTGPDSKLIAKKTVYDGRGAVRQVSLPYFDGLETPRYAATTYDAPGRVVRIDLPDNTFTLSCYSGFTTATIDGNGHKKRETKNAQGKLVQVDEYTGSYAGCDTTSGTIYSTTVYQYDTLGNLRFVTDGQGNQTEMRYDPLGRKIWMHDPDMGNWTYAYDNNGNLVSQQDAKGQWTYSQYDALNRLRQKDYLIQKTLGLGDVVYNYDELTSTNGKGRLTSMADASGRESYQYDLVGQTLRTDKVVNLTTYTTLFGYDQAGRQTSVTYPDNSVVTFTYNGPFLSQVTEGTTIYAAYGGYNAQGQPGTVTYANGVTTSYTYAATNNRLQGISTVKGATTYQSLSYSYDNVGNIATITDAINGNQTFTYDDLNRLAGAAGAYGSLSYTYDKIGNMTFNSQLGAYTYPASGANSVQPHAVIAAGGNTYTYDANGNMSAGAGRTFTYDVENRPISITASGAAVALVYDGHGSRVMKTAGSTTTVYVGGLYECTNGVCEKYIFAKGKRIAKKTVGTGATNYYHADHLGSSSVMTDSLGNLAENVAYYPYGGTRTDTGSISVRHKFTGQEYDAETGLYFYGARYYDPVLGRFISADSIIPYPNDPQSFNRYSYCRNNPIIYTDPSGHTPILAFLADLLGKLLWGAIISLADTTINHKSGPDIRVDIGTNGSNVSAAGGSTTTAGGSATPDPEKPNYDFCTDKFGYAPIDADLYPQNTLLYAACKFGPDAILFAAAPELMVPKGLLGLGKIGAATRDVAGNSAITGPLWTATKDKTSVQNAFNHFIDHGSEFGAQNAIDYVKQTQNFLRNPPAGTLTSVRTNGDIVRYNPSTNTFGVMDVTGAPRTMFKPDPAIHGYQTNLEYFYAQ